MMERSTSDIVRKQGIQERIKKCKSGRLFRSDISIWWSTAAFLISRVESKVQISPDELVSFGNGLPTEFSAHSAIRPQVFHAGNGEEITDTTVNDFDHADELIINLRINGIPRTLDLHLNKDLIPKGYKQRTHDQGTFWIETPERVELCHYQGSIRGVPESQISISTCRGLRGVIDDTSNIYVIHPDKNSLNSTHRLYQHSGLISTGNHESNDTLDIIPPEIEYRSKRELKDLADTSIRGPANANNQSRYIELLFVIETRLFREWGNDLNVTHHNCKDLANILYGYFTPLNIFVALVGVEVWTNGDAIEMSHVGGDTLSRFVRYRKKELLNKIPHDCAHLLTTFAFKGVSALAYVNTICSSDTSGALHTIYHPEAIAESSRQVAHELGHNVGFSHDRAGCKCSKRKCFMGQDGPSADPQNATGYWSSCNMEQLTRSFAPGNKECLLNKPQRLFEGPLCGNGFVEAGEECDCGLAEHCTSTCCDPTTCKLKPNATCATGECCDLQTCQFKVSGIPCRPAQNECQLTEFCLGNNEFCPTDVHKLDGTVCRKGEAFCFEGLCQTHEDSCKSVFGPDARSIDTCYAANRRGTLGGHCGYNPVYKPCDPKDILCGRAQCELPYKQKAYRGNWAGAVSVSVGRQYCLSAFSTAGFGRPGMVANGAKCGNDSMCVDQQCWPIDEYMETQKVDPICRGGCNGNGVCNSLGSCHCSKGFQPPDCVQKGRGGSEHSGPEEPDDQRIYCSVFGNVSDFLSCTIFERSQGCKTLSNLSAVALSLYTCISKILNV